MKNSKSVSNQYLTVAFFAAFTFQSLQAEPIRYHFTGTIEKTDPSIGFSSPETVIPGLTANPGDQVTGSFVLNLGGPDVFLSRDYNGLDYVRDVSEFRLQIHGQELFPEDTPPGDAIAVNNPTLEMSRLERKPLATAPADFIAISNPIGGSTIGGQDKVGFVLNLTDSTGTVFQEKITPDKGFPEPIDFTQFDIAKGFLMTWWQFSAQADSGIMFNIDSLETDVPNSSEPIKLTTGFHVSWPADTVEHILEEAPTPDGPWIPSSVPTVEVDGANVVIMNMEARSKFYRLSEAN